MSGGRERWFRAVLWWPWWRLRSSLAGVRARRLQETALRHAGATERRDLTALGLALREERCGSGGGCDG